MSSWRYGSKWESGQAKISAARGGDGSRLQFISLLKVCQGKKIYTLAALLVVALLAIATYFGSVSDLARTFRKPGALKAAVDTWFEEERYVELACSAGKDPAIEELMEMTEQRSKDDWPPEGEWASEIPEIGTGTKGEEPFDEEKVVKLIRSMVHPRLKRPSPYQYDTCITAIVRNEYYLKEWLVRNILAGFQKVFLYDDSWGPGDTKIANLIRPFVKAGVVEYRTRDKCVRAKLKREWATRDDWLQEVTEKHGKTCMWLMRLDSDEIVYPLGYPQERLPEWLAGNEDKYCEIRLNWLFPYSGGASRRRGFALGETLLESYPNMCFEKFLPKHLLQFNNVTGIGGSVHRTVFKEWYNFECKANLTVLDERWVSTEPNPENPPRPLLLHYYTKSLEDFLVKKEQCLGPIWRQFWGYYDDGRTSCQLEKKPIPYSPQYIRDVVRIMSVQFTQDPAQDSAGEVFEREIMTKEEAGDLSDYETYLFVKKKIREGKWFNQTCYYEKYPDVAEAVRNGTFCDATYYFVSTGFYQKQFGCWEGGKEAYLL